MTSFETAQEVFRNHTASEIQTISATLTQLAQDRHQTLQNLVSGKYRELLTTADLIVEMEQISQRQDANLYELSFLKNKKLDKLSRIESNLQSFYKDVELPKVENHVLTNSNNFLQYSKFLNIGDDDILTIITQLNELELPIVKDSWFYDRKDTILEKFKYLLDVIHDRSHNLTSIDEMKEVYTFLENLVILDDERADMKRFNEKFLEIFIGIVENGGALAEILKKFQFKDQLKSHYSKKLESLFQELDAVDLSKKDDELELYNLEINEDYLYNIKMLNQGLIYASQRHFNDLLISSIQTLEILKQLGSDKTEQLLKYISKLQGSKKLEKYTRELQSSLKS